MKHVLSTLALFCFSIYSSAQISNALSGTNEVIREKANEDIDGTPYLFKNWYPGTITDNLGKTYSDLLIRYDIYKERVEFTENGKVYEVATSLYRSFTLNVLSENVQEIKKYNFTNEQVLPGFPKNSYYQVLVEGKYKLYKKYKVLFIEENASSYGAAVMKKRYQSESIFFIKSTSEIKSVKPSKKSILESFPEFESSLKSSKIKNENDLVSFLKEVNSK